MKKSIACFIAVCMCAGILAGCSVSEQGANSTPTDETQASGAVHSTEKPTSSSQETEKEESETEPTIPPPTEPKTFDISLSFAGDMMLASFKDQTTAGSFNEYANEKSPDYFLEKVKPIFEKDDFTIANLENVLSDSNLSPVAKDHSPAYWYKSKTSNTDILKAGSVEAVSLANNHNGDYGSQGRQDTLSAVKNAGLFYGEQGKTMMLEKQGFKIAVICTGMWSEWQAENIVKEIDKAEETSDYQIVFFHGGTERLHKPENWKVRSAHKLVDAGADLVVGGHPHVLQPREIYNRKEIVYSIGNFCYGGNKRPENRTVIYQMKLTVNADTMEVQTEQSNIIPCYVYEGNVNNYRPAPIENEAEKNKVLSFMEGKENSPL